jgi:hypothetical protein
VFEMPMPGMLLVRYREARDMEPARQGPLVEAIRAASRVRPIAVVFVIGEGVVSVDFAVPSFWIKVVADPSIQIGAMAMVTGSLAVEIAAKSFAAASRFRRQPIEVRTFTEERAATSWARQMLFAPAPMHP